jgi:hypothetical protein
VNDWKLAKKREDEIYLASAVHFLLQGGDEEAARLLISCESETWREHDQQYGECWFVRLRGSRQFYDTFTDYKHPAHEAIDLAFRAVLPRVDSGYEGHCVVIQPHASLVEVDTDWRVKLLADAETGDTHNQNSYNSKPIVYAGMRFSSPPEVEIAKALDNLGVMYLPNCLTRVGSTGNRQNRFPDFLICYRGKWGLLEVDGQTYHSGRATEDHERSRLIEKHGGIAYFTRFDAQRCMKDPEGVVQEFLEILGSK